MTEVQTQLSMIEPKGFSWKKYNLSQTKEKNLFLKFLKELCDVLPDKYKTTGSKPMRLRRLIFAICMKSYCIKSGRRIISELELCQKIGYLDKNIHFNSIFECLKNPNLTPILQDLIKFTSIPLAPLENKLCGDSTGFGTRVLHDRWSVIRQNYEKHHQYMKLHASFGTLTNIITSCRVTEAKIADSPMLSVLVDESCENFNPKEYSWDKAYLSRDNLQTIWEKNCLPLIPFKSNCVGKKGNMIWKEMYNFFDKNNSEFMRRYHLRSNSEAGFHALKSKFGDLTCMRNETGMINDILAKCLVYNLCVLVKAIFMFDLKINFAQFKKVLEQV